MNSLSYLSLQNWKLRILLLGGIFVLALTFRLLHYHMEGVIARDGVLYADMAGSWAEYGFRGMVEAYGAKSWIPPLYLWIMKIFIPLGISAEAIGLGLNLLLGSLLPLIVFYIARICLEHDEMALAAALLMACHPPVIELSGEVIRDILYLFLSGLLILSLLCAAKNVHSLWQWGIAGILLGGNLLVRYESFEFFIFITGYFVIVLFIRQMSFKKILLKYSIFVVGCIVCIAFLFALMKIPPQHYLKHYQDRIKNVLKYSGRI